ncbi:MAG: efflux RND transporter periplasmic adaptor subunit [Deltaproteobacteria bacterium]|nr:efflux RND transporter periplasmic adaptor subunit [Deltaproteobacteria bacterium]
MIPINHRVGIAWATVAFGAAVLFMAGCGNEHGHEHPPGSGEPGHEHPHGGGEPGHEHPHGGGEPGHEHPHPGDDHEGLAAQSVTIWAEKTELFMEYEPLIIGHESRFAAHLTTMNDFKAVTSGDFFLTVALEDGTVLKSRAKEPASPGIFRFTISPTKAGVCGFSLFYQGQGITDTIDAGACRVFPDEKAALAGLHGEEKESGIAYTKEQQWKTDFATVQVQKQPLQPSVRAVGEIKPVSGREARLTSPARGRLTLVSPAPMPGMKVKKGQLLATVSPYLAAGGDRATLAAEGRSAQAELTAAQSQLERLERLLKEQAVPEKRVEDARARVSVAKAKLDGANGRLQQYNQGAAGVSGRGPGAYKLRSTIEGTLVEVNATNGDSVEEGNALFVVVDLTKIWLVAKVFEPDIPKVESAKAAWFAVEGYDKPFTIDDNNGRLITVGQVIDPKSRTAEVIFEMENPDGKIRIGQFAEVFISTGEPREVVAVPTSALLDDGGKKVAYVMAEGETFFRRVLKTGIRSKGWVEVVGGIQAGERVVTRGAYQVRLAAASGAIPSHGHVH